MRGQHKLLEKVNHATLDTIPKTLMLLGRFGCGKHTVASCLAKSLCIPLNDISNSVNQETIDSLYNVVSATMIVIDTNLITEKQQNQLLKIIEEPPSMIYIVLLCENLSRILPTIINRCQVWEFERYTPQELSDIAGQVDPTVLKIATTPGEITLLKNTDLPNCLELCNKMMDSIGKANISNALSISNKIAFKDEKDKLNFRALCLCLGYTVTQKMYERCDEKDIARYYVTMDFLSKLSSINNVNKKILFEKYLIKLRRASI